MRLAGTHQMPSTGCSSGSCQRHSRHTAQIVHTHLRQLTCFTPCSSSAHHRSKTVPKQLLCKATERPATPCMQADPGHQSHQCKTGCGACTAMLHARGAVPTRRRDSGSPSATQGVGAGHRHSPTLGAASGGQRGSLYRLSAHSMCHQYPFPVALLGTTRTLIERVRSDYGAIHHTGKPAM